MELKTFFKLDVSLLRALANALMICLFLIIEGAILWFNIFWVDNPTILKVIVAAVVAVAVLDVGRAYIRTI